MCEYRWQFPPESLSMLPYGPNYPVDTGEFFIPSSAALLVAALGAVIAGWRTASHYRILLLLSLAMILGTLILTVIEFWPRNAALWAVAQGTASAIQDQDAIIRMVREWIALDWVRIAMGTVGFVATIRAISIPYPEPAEVPMPVSLQWQAIYGIVIASVVLFAVFFVSRF